MAFPGRNTNTLIGQQDDSWKAQAFINFWVPSVNGTSDLRKLGSIPLKENKEFEAMLIARLQEAGGIEALSGAITITFQMVNNAPITSVGF